MIELVDVLKIGVTVVAVVFALSGLAAISAARLSSRRPTPPLPPHEAASEPDPAPYLPDSGHRKSGAGSGP